MKTKPKKVIKKLTDTIRDQLSTIDDLRELVDKYSESTTLKELSLTKEALRNADFKIKELNDITSNQNEHIVKLRSWNRDYYIKEKNSDIYCKEQKDIRESHEEIIVDVRKENKLLLTNVVNSETKILHLTKQLKSSTKKAQDFDNYIKAMTWYKLLMKQISGYYKQNKGL